MSCKYWLVVGKPANWRTAFDHGNIWGLKKTQEHLWQSLQEGDRLLFYATKPTGGIIGHGSVRTKFRQDRPLWPKEVEDGKVIWPLRFEFDVHYCLPPVEWEARRLVSKDLMPQAEFQPLAEHIGEALVRSLGAPAHAPHIPSTTTGSEPSPGFQANAETSVETAPSHREIQESLVEIGRLQNFIAEREYPFGIGKLDVVWRRVQQSVPTYVFEIQIGGNVYQALAKLKHAYDLWNSHLFLVASRDDFSKANQLLSGTFHEVRDRMKLLDILEVRELLARKKAYRDLEDRIGIL